METYNEKQIKLNREIREKREAAFQAFNTKRQQLLAEKQKAGQTYDEEKKQLQTELDNVLKERLLLKKGGMTVIAEQYQSNLLREHEIHKAQYEGKIRFMDERRKLAQLDNLLIEEYRIEKQKIADEKTERLLIIEKEERERKELLSLTNENKED